MGIIYLGLDIGSVSAKLAALRWPEGRGKADTIFEVGGQDSKFIRIHDGIPIKNFYFDATASDLDRDVVIFLELCRNFRRKRGRPL